MLSALADRLEKKPTLLPTPGLRNHWTVNVTRELAGSRIGALLRLRSSRIVCPEFLTPSFRPALNSFARSVHCPKMVLRPGKGCFALHRANGSFVVAPWRVRGVPARASTPGSVVVVGSWPTPLVRRRDVYTRGEVKVFASRSSSDASEQSSVLLLRELRRLFT